MLTDLRYALRALLRNPGFTLVAVMTLALGIGANAAMFGIVDALLLRPPPGVRDPGHLVRVYWANTWRVLGSVVQPSGSYPAYESIRDNARTLQGTAAEWPRTISVGRGAQAQQIGTSLVSHTYFPLLGLSPALGRFLLAYVVGQQTREIGVRVALGAKSSQVMRLVLASALRVTLAGVLLGVAATLVVGRVVASLLYGVQAADPGVIGLAALVLVATAIAAGALPARRAMQVDPMEALRYE